MTQESINTTKEATPKKKQARKKKANSKKAPTGIAWHTKGIIGTSHLEAEFGMKAKVIRRHLRKMEASTKPRGPQRYEWEAGSAELKAIRKSLAAIVEARNTNVR